MIHHYTSVATLALMLESKKIRFTRLDCFDDILEAKTFRNIDFGNQLFASCWTKAEESIPQWYMYGSQLSGVRLSFPKNDLFSFHQLKGGRRVERNGATFVIDFPIPLDAPYPLEAIYGSGYLLVPEVNMKQDFLRDIEYVDNLSVAFAELEGRITKEGQNTTIQGVLSDFGLHKSNIWSFQNECRFILTAKNYPMHQEVSDDDFFNHFANGEHLKPIQIRNIDLPYNPQALDQLVVTLGPSVTKADEIIVNSLLEKYAPNSKLEVSKLSGKIRNVIR